MDIDKTIDAFRRGEIDLDCKEIVLHQSKENGARFEGPGYIRQNSEGVLIFKLYVTKSENVPSLLEAQMNLGPGKLHTDENFCDLKAIAHDGTHWTADRILPGMKQDRTTGSFVLAHGEMRSITASLDEPQRQNYLRLYFFEEYDVPLLLMSKVEEDGNECMVRDRAEFEACGSMFKVRKRNRSGEIVIEVTSDADWPTAFHLRIQEALQYITGKVAIWGARVESDGRIHFIELASPLRKSRQYRPFPPISPASTDFYKFGWNLFACYLSYVMATTKNTYWNPVAYHLYNAYEAKSNSIDAWAVGISVAVEAVASLIKLQVAENENQKDGITNDNFSLLQNRMIEFLKTQTEFSAYFHRMESAIKKLAEKRPQDTMHDLAKGGYVEKLYVTAWSELRNRQVHPKLADLKKPDQITNQKLVDRIHKVEVLLRQLTFYLIEYKGPFTDYGVKSYPSKQYPLTPPQSSQAASTSHHTQPD